MSSTIEEEHIIGKVSNDLRDTLLVDALSLFASHVDLSLFDKCVTRVIDDYKNNAIKTVIGGTPELARRIEERVLSDLNDMLAGMLQARIDAQKEEHHTH